MTAKDLADQFLSELDTQQQLVQKFVGKLEPLVGEVRLQKDPHSGICYALPQTHPWFGQGKTGIEALQNLLEQFERPSKALANKRLEVKALTRVLASAAREQGLPRDIVDYLNAEHLRYSRELQALEQKQDPDFNAPYPSPN